MRKTVLAVLAALFVSVLPSVSFAQDPDICYGNGTQKQSVTSRLLRLAQAVDVPLPRLPPLRDFVPWRKTPNHWVNGLVSPATPLDKIVELAKKCFGEYGCMHPYLHPDYRDAFVKLKCHCHTGYCRPSEFRPAAMSSTNDTGLQVKANGVWCDVMTEHLRRDRNKIPERLLAFPGHVCVGTKGCEDLECAIDPNPRS